MMPDQRFFGGPKLEAFIVVTYRCNAQCRMCHTWQHPSSTSREFSPRLIDKLPSQLAFINITGGEPFLRSDIETIIENSLTKSKRVLISTNGYFTKRVLAAANRFGNRIGFRISIEGLPAVNDELRGIKNGFDHGIRTLISLKTKGIKDIGVGITVSDRNAKDMIELYRLAEAMGLEFATAVTHNSFYFHRADNQFNDQAIIAEAFEKNAISLLQTSRPKNWFRAYFNMGLANKVMRGKRPLPCDAGTDIFFLDPYGNVLACNGSKDPMIMGNLDHHCFKTIWHSKQAEQVRNQVKHCSKQCWMIGSASPAIKRRITVPAKWIVKNKFKLLKTNGRPVKLDSV